MELLAAVAALTTSLVLLASAVGHLRRPVTPDLAAHGVLGRGTRQVVAVALPAVELLLGLAGLTARAPVLVAQGVLFAAFAGYLALVVRVVGVRTHRRPLRLRVARGAGRTGRRRTGRRSSPRLR